MGNVVFKAYPQMEIIQTDLLSFWIIQDLYLRTLGTLGQQLLIHNSILESPQNYFPSLGYNKVCEI